MHKLVVVSELYYPEETSTGYFLTGIAEGIQARGDFEVRALSVEPTYSKRGESAPKYEVRAGVHIHRLSAPIGNKNKLLGRLWNMLSLTFRMGLALGFAIKRDDYVLVVTNPPSLPLLVGWIARLKGAHPVLLMHDVYPDVLVPTGFTNEKSLIYRGIDRLQQHMLQLMSGIVVLGRDMEKRVARKCPHAHANFSIIPNWGDVERIIPNARSQNPVRVQHVLEDKFIVQFSGNLGRTHGLEDVVEISKRLLGNQRICFLIFGWGAGRDWLEDQIKEHQLDNVLLLPPCHKDELGDYLNACDLFFMPFKDAMEGISVPSRMYNVMAAGNAFLAVTSDQSELAKVVEEEGIGYVVAPKDLEGMQRCIEQALNHPERLAEMRLRSRQAALQKYTQSHVVDAYNKLFNNLAQKPKI